MPKKVEQLIEDFWSPSKRELAYTSLLEIARNKISKEKKEATLFLLSIFPCLKDKSQVEDLLHRILRSRDSELKGNVLFSIGPQFRYFSNKSEVWQDLHKLTLSRDSWIREAVAFSIGPAFAFIPEKEQAMKDLFRLAKYADYEVQESVGMSIGFAFPYLFDKSKAWNILFKMAMEGDCDAGLAAVKSLRYAFPYVPDKLWAWEDMLEIINSNLDLCSYAATSSLFYSYQWYPNKLSGYDDLVSLTTHKSKGVRDTSKFSFGMIFSYIPDKERGQNDLISLLNGENIDCKDNILISLGNAFSYLPDKIKVWKILHEYTKSNDASLRKGAAFAIGDACPDLPFPEDSLNDLTILVSDENSSVRMAVAHSLGLIYSHVWGSDLVLSCLNTLSEDTDSYVRMRANYSLGKICIYEASRTKEKKDLEYLLEKTVNYFEKATNEECCFNPASFCYLFYRSFDAVAFKKEISKEEIERFIIGAKNEAEDSINKRKLIEVIERLSTVLYVAKGSHEIDFESTVEFVEFCRQHCNYAEALMDETKGTAPNLNQIFHNVLPLFNETIQELIDDVKEKAEAACKSAKGTLDAEEACSLYKESKKLSEAENNDANFSVVSSMVFILKGKINKNPEYHYLLSEITKIDSESSLNQKLGIIRDILGVVEFGSSSIETNKKLDEIHEITKSNASSINQIQKATDILMESIDELQNPQEYLNSIQECLEEIKDEIPDMKKQIDEVLYEMYSPMAIDQKLKFAIPIIPLIASYEFETNPPKFVADSISALKKLVMKNRE